MSGHAELGRSCTQRVAPSAVSALSRSWVTCAAQEWGGEAAGGSSPWRGIWGEGRRAGHLHGAGFGGRGSGWVVSTAQEWGRGKEEGFTCMGGSTAWGVQLHVGFICVAQVREEEASSAQHRGGSGGR
eukprot:144729-Chlamydomonas_euryale.AAC.1